MGIGVKILAAVVTVTALGCLKPQTESPGAQTPASRSTPPETANNLVTDGPLQPRSSAARPPPKEHGPSTEPTGLEPKPAPKANANANAKPTPTNK